MAEGKTLREHYRDGDHIPGEPFPSGTVAAGEMLTCGNGTWVPCEDQTHAALKDHELDKLAAEAARPLAVIFDHMGWKWGTPPEDRVPTEGEIALSIRRKLQECELDWTVSSGRVVVGRWIEDGAECANVTLNVADIAAKEVRDVA